jgi:hypothetical protein
VSDNASKNAAKINVRVRVKPLRFFPKYIAVPAGSIRRQEGNPERGIALGAWSISDDPYRDVPWHLETATGRCPIATVYVSTSEPRDVKTSARKDPRCLLLGTPQSIGWNLGIVVERNSDLWIFREGP